MRAFHFLSTKYALETIEKQRIKVSRLDDLNDPFELYALELSNKKHRQAFRAWKKDVAQKTGLLCFSKSWGNPLLWSHYADRHKGVALEFEIPDEFINEISYFPERLVLDIDKKLSVGGLDEKDVQCLLTTKFKHWEYENEVRVFLRISECISENGLWFYRIGDEIKLVGIVYGPLCQLLERDIASRLPKGKTLSLTKARLAFKTFSVVKNLRVDERIIEGKA